MSESASTSSVGSNSSHSKAPGSQLTHKPIPFPRPQTTIATRELTKQLLAIDNDPTLGAMMKNLPRSISISVDLFSDAIEREQRKQTLCLAYSGIGAPSSFFSTGNDTVESVVGKPHIFFA